MNPAIETIKKRVQELVRQGSQFPGNGGSPNALFDISTKYHAWYGACLGIIEANMASRLAELKGLHRAVHLSENTLRASPNAADYHERSSAQNLRRCISQICGIIGSVPDYLEARFLSLELSIAHAYVTDQLVETEVLLRAGHVRAAGAIAGVLLERHLKLLCDRQDPPIAFGDKATIAKLNDPLRDAGVYDIAQWRKVQWMADIRNLCDHAALADPRLEDVRDLISEVGKFVSLFGG